MTRIEWVQRAAAGAAPPARRDHSLVTDGANLYLFGGRDQDGDLADLWAYTIAQDEWFDLTPPGGPTARHGHNAVWDATSGRMLVFGGQAGASFFNDIWAFDPATRAWADLLAAADPVSLPEPRYGAGGAIDLDGRLWITHGFTTNGRFDDSWRFDGGWTDVSPDDEPPLARCLIRAVWDPLRDRLIIFGGQSTEEPFLGDLWMLSNTGWRELPRDPAPSPRNLYALAYDPGPNKVLLFGGQTAEGPANDLWLLDAQDEFWTSIVPDGEPPSPRSAHDGAWVEDLSSLFVFGGNDGSTDRNDLWQLTLQL